MNAMFLGTLEFAAFSANSYKKTTVTVLELLANQASVAIGNAIAYALTFQSGPWFSPKFSCADNSTPRLNMSRSIRNRQSLLLVTTS